MPASVSTMFACSARCSLCASATSALACLAAASSAGRAYPERRLSRGSSPPVCKGTDSGKPKGRPIGGGGGGRDADDEAPSSENMRPIVVSGFWIVRSSPVMGAVMSDSFWSVERRGADGPAPSYEDSGGPDFSLNICCCCSWGPFGDMAWCFSAIAETAASTFFSNSASVIVKEVRSMFSMN